MRRTRIRFAIWALAAISAAIPSFALAESVAYFSRLAGIISPLLEYNPRGKISADEALQIPHYRVTYDDNGRLHRIRYFHHSWPSDDSYFSAHEVRYEYRGNDTIRRYFDLAGQSAVMWRHYYRSETVHKEVFRRRDGEVSLTMFGLDGKQISVGTGTQVFKMKPISDQAFIQWQYKEDGSNNVIFDYLPFEAALISKDENGFLHQIIALDRASAERGEVNMISHPLAGFAEMRLDFDQFGNEMGWDFRDLEGNLVNRASNNIDPGYAAWRYEFDWVDRRLGLYRGFRERYFDQREQPFCKPNGTCEIRYEFAASGPLSSISNYDALGKIHFDADSNHARAEYQSDERGRRTQVQYLDQDGEPVRSGVALRRYAYPDDASKPVISEFDAQMEPLLKATAG